MRHRSEIRGFHNGEDDDDDDNNDVLLDFGTT
jgi:hypothetical protein